MVQLKVGDTVTLCAAVRPFCGTLGAQFYVVHDLDCAVGSCPASPFPYTWDCLTPSGVSVEFQWTSYGYNNTCNPAYKLKSLGTATTNSVGMATIQYQITENDLDIYNNNIGAFDLRVCFNNGGTENRIYSKAREKADGIIIVKNLCQNVQCPDTCFDADLWSMKCDPPTGACVQDVLKQASSPQCTITTTHILDLNVSPFSWYTSQGAADYLITNMTGINGAVVNWLAPFTGWTYIYTEIINNGSNVIIRIHLNDGSTAAPSMVSASNMQSLAVQIGLLEIGFIVVFVGVITLTVGIIMGVAFIKVLTGTKEVEKQFTPQDVVSIVITDPDSVVAEQLKGCDAAYLADATNLKICYDVVISGAQRGLANKLNLPPPTIDTPVETQKCLDQYLIDSNWANYQTCLKGVSGKAGAELLDGVTCPAGQYYNVDQGKCITTEDCWIAGFTPGTCMLTAKTGKTIALIGGVVIGGYLIFSLIKK